MIPGCNGDHCLVVDILTTLTYSVIIVTTKWDGGGGGGSKRVNYGSADFANNFVQKLKIFLGEATTTRETLLPYICVKKRFI